MTNDQQGSDLREGLLNHDNACSETTLGSEEPSRSDTGLPVSVVPGDEEAALLNTEKDGVGEGKVSWIMMTCILLGDMFGLGTLTLPASFARLGWILSLLIMLICVLGTLYSGRLFTKLSQQVPGARVFDDLGKAALGPTGQRLVYFTVYSTILMNPIIFQLTSVESLQQILFQRHLPALVIGGIVVALILPLAQIQGLEDVAALSGIGTVGMVVAVGVAVGKLLALESPSTRTELFHKPSDWSTPFVALLDLVFTYGGQVNWVRYISQMRRRSHYPRSVAATTVVMTGAYVVMGAVGYMKLGPDFDHQKPITSVLPQDAFWTPVMNMGLFAHCILAYQINLNVWTDLVIHLLAPVAHWSEETARKPGWLIWGSTSISGIAISFLVAATFPFFSTVAAIIASLGDLAGAYGMPAIFLLTLAGGSLALWERRLLKAIVPASLALSAVGLVCSLTTLAKEFLH